MKLNRFTVSFEEQDMHFLKDTGLFKATRMVRKHFKEHTTPFIYDTYQLARAIAVPRNMLFELTRDTSKHYKLIMLRKKNGGLRYIHRQMQTAREKAITSTARLVKNVKKSSMR